MASAIRWRWHEYIALMRVRPSHSFNSQPSESRFALSINLASGQLGEIGRPLSAYRCSSSIALLFAWTNVILARPADSLRWPLGTNNPVAVGAQISPKLRI